MDNLKQMTTGKHFLKKKMLFHLTLKNLMSQIIQKSCRVDFVENYQKWMYNSLHICCKVKAFEVMY